MQRRFLIKASKKVKTLASFRLAYHYDSAGARYLLYSNIAYYQRLGAPCILAPDDLPFPFFFSLTQYLYKIAIHKFRFRGICASHHNHEIKQYFTILTKVSAHLTYSELQSIRDNLCFYLDKFIYYLESNNRRQIYANDLGFFKFLIDLGHMPPQ